MLMQWSSTYRSRRPWFRWGCCYDGPKNGVAGLMKKHLNPLLQNVHCIAHHLALVTSQAAKEVLYLKKYHTILGNLFYYFRGLHSAVRSAKLAKIQEILDSPTLTLKELHGLR